MLTTLVKIGPSISNHVLFKFFLYYSSSMTHGTSPDTLIRPEPFDTLVFDISYALSRTPYRVKPSRLDADEHYRMVAKAVVEHLRVCGWRLERDAWSMPGPNGFVGDGRKRD